MRGLTETWHSGGRALANAVMPLLAILCGFLTAAGGTNFAQKSFLFLSSDSDQYKSNKNPNRSSQKIPKTPTKQTLAQARALNQQWLILVLDLPVYISECMDEF